MSNKIEKYAELIVKIGLNLQKDQILVINSPINCADFARKVTVKAYEAGAKEVVLRWSDEESTKIRYMMASDKVFDEYPKWAVDFGDYYVNKGAAFLSIAASDPELMKDVDPKRMGRQNKAQSIAIEYFRSKLMAHENVWCVASIPTEAWAKKVFPNAGDKAVEKLWNAIFKSVRVDRDDPIKEWQEHQKTLTNRLNYLNKNRFKYLKYKNSIGTDVIVELPKDHIWYGGSCETPKGHEFTPNLPTEEIFTMPKHDGVNGKVVSSIPLNYHGNLIEDFTFTLKDGVIVEYSAKKGLDTLRELLETDKGAKKLGEVALVPYDSPISNQNILFYNTLYDENASCHFALGKAYPINIKDGEKMDKEELLKAGANDSLVHVDFMMGTSDLNIIGIKEDGSQTPIFKDGNFAI